MRPGTLLRWYALNGILKSAIKNASVILDIGGFDGYIFHEMSREITGKDITVVDLDKSGLKTAREMGLKTLEASVMDLPFPDSHADLILCLDLLEHVEDDGRVMQEISRVLKKDGTIVLTTPMEEGVSFQFMKRERIESINRGWGHIRLGYSLDQIKRIFIRNGLEIITISRYFNFFTRLVYRFTFLSKSFRFNWSVYESALKLEPYFKLGSQEYIIVAKKPIIDDSQPFLHGPTLLKKGAA